MPAIENSYIEMLIQSLEKKLIVLKEIREKNEEQRILLLDNELSPDEFIKNINNKQNLVDGLEKLDEGFDNVYQHVREELQANQQQYKSQIKILQDLIRDITAESTSIKAEEQRNYKLAQNKFNNVKNQVREIKASHHAVQKYYRNMMKINLIDPQFMDDKK